jgi:hypothetical protein
MRDRRRDAESLAKQRGERGLDILGRMIVGRPLRVTADIAAPAKDNPAIRALLPVVESPSCIRGTGEIDFECGRGREHLETRASNTARELGHDRLEAAVDGDDDVVSRNAAARRRDATVVDRYRRGALEQPPARRDRLARELATSRGRIVGSIRWEKKSPTLGTYVRLDRKTVTPHCLELARTVILLRLRLGNAQGARAPNGVGRFGNHPIDLI